MGILREFIAKSSLSPGCVITFFLFLNLYIFKELCVCYGLPDNFFVLFLIHFVVNFEESLTLSLLHILSTGKWPI